MAPDLQNRKGDERVGALAGELLSALPSTDPHEEAPSRDSLLRMLQEGVPLERVAALALLYFPNEQGMKERDALLEAYFQKRWPTYHEKHSKEVEWKKNPKAEEEKVLEGRTTLISQAYSLFQCSEKQRSRLLHRCFSSSLPHKKPRLMRYLEEQKWTQEDRKQLALAFVEEWDPKKPLMQRPFSFFSLSYLETKFGLLLLLPDLGLSTEGLEEVFEKVKVYFFSLDLNPSEEEAPNWDGNLPECVSGVGGRTWTKALKTFLKGLPDDQIKESLQKIAFSFLLISRYYAQREAIKALLSKEIERWKVLPKEDADSTSSVLPLSHGPLFGSFVVLGLEGAWNGEEPMEPLIEICDKILSMREGPNKRDCLCKLIGMTKEGLFPLFYRWVSGKIYAWRFLLYLMEATRGEGVDEATLSAFLSHIRLDLKNGKKRATLQLIDMVQLFSGEAAGGVFNVLAASVTKEEASRKEFFNLIGLFRLCLFCEEPSDDIRFERGFIDKTLYQALVAEVLKGGSNWKEWVKDRMQRKMGRWMGNALSGYEGREQLFIEWWHDSAIRQRFDTIFLNFCLELRKMGGSDIDGISEAVDRTVERLILGTSREARYDPNLCPQLAEVEKVSPGLCQKWQTLPDPEPMDPCREQVLSSLEERGSWVSGLEIPKGIRDQTESELQRAFRQLCLPELSLLETWRMTKKLLFLCDADPALKRVGWWERKIEERLTELETRLAPLSTGEKFYSIEITDKVELLLDSGTELGTCVSMLDPYNRHTLPSYVEDGKIQVVMVQKEGKLIARAMLKLLLQKKGPPVLYMAHVHGDPTFSTKLYERAKRRAIELGIPLALNPDLNISSFDPIAKKEKGWLISVGSPSPYEYNDYGAPSRGSRWGKYSFEANIYAFTS